MLDGVRVIEVADEQAEYCGLLLAGLGADVIKVEPPGGSPTRAIGPFYEDSEDPERSLFFWQYNRGKRSVVARPRRSRGDRGRVARARSRGADVLLRVDARRPSSSGRGRRAGRAVPGPRDRARHAVRRRRPVGRLQGLRPGPPGARRPDDELRLRPRPGGPLRPAADRAADVARLPHRRRAARRWRSSAALLYRRRTGEGQVVCVRRARGGREEHRARPDELGHAAGAATCARPAATRPSGRTRSRHDRQTKDGRWFMMTSRSAPRDRARLVEFLGRYGMAARPRDRRADADSFGDARRIPGTRPRSRPSAQRRRGRAALRRQSTLRRHAVARRAGGGLALRRRCASRTRTRSMRTGRREGRSPTSSTPSSGVASPIRSASGSSTRTAVAVGPARAAARRGRRRRSRPSRRGPGSQVVAPAPASGPRDRASALGQAVRARRRPDPRLHLVPRLGRRDPLPRRARRREHQGRVEGPPRHARGRDGAGRRAGGARDRDRAVAGRHRPRHGRAVQQQEPGQARASRSTSRHPRGLEIARELVRDVATSSPRASRPA